MEQININEAFDRFCSLEKWEKQEFLAKIFGYTNMDIFLICGYCGNVHIIIRKTGDEWYCNNCQKILDY